MLKENRVFFIGFGILFFATLLLFFFTKNGDVVLYFHEQRTEGMTHFFDLVTRLGEAPPYFIAFFFLLYYRNLREGLFLGFTGAVVTIVAFLLKTYFAHPRPRPYFESMGIFSGSEFPQWLYVHGGHNAFPSGHTMSAFALYALIAFFVPKKKWFAIFMLLLAVGVGFSRIYLFHHFLKDVIFGAGVGVLIAWGLFEISKRTLKNWDFSLGEYLK